MKPRNGAIAGLLFLATCSRDFQDSSSSNLESSQSALGTVPPTEVAVWQKVAAINLPDYRYLQAAAFDEIRRVVVMFGGMAINTDTYPLPITTSSNGETWEWSPATGKWTDRTGSGSIPDAGSAPAPDPRSGAGMVFDSARDKFVLFGGRAGSGYDLEDTWEWDPTTGAWTDVTAAGSHPLARCQHGMVYEKATGKILLFGGGRSDTSTSDATAIAASLGDTWEYDPATYTWKQLPVTAGPSARHAFGMVWDSARGKAVLFGGMQTDKPGAAGTPMQDTWEWDGAASAWTERTAVGIKPSQRYGHSMAFDGSRGKVLLFGGFDMSTGGSLRDLWELDPTTWTWTDRSPNDDSYVPMGRMYASLVSDDVGGRLELVAGAVVYTPSSNGGSSGSSGLGSRLSAQRDVWEIAPVKPLFTDRSPGSDIPDHISHPAFAYNPATGKTYLYGGGARVGSDYRDGYPLGELCDWDSEVWSCPEAVANPDGHVAPAMAYDPARNSLIAFGGIDNIVGDPDNDTWEFSADGKWTQLHPARSPTPVSRHRMVTDTTRKKILLFGGIGRLWSSASDPSPEDPYNITDVWEWDGAAMTWTNRTPPVSTNVPAARDFPLLTYDEGRQKMFLFDGQTFHLDGWDRHGSSATAYREWDPITAGWAQYDTGDSVGDIGGCAVGAYDSIRRRQVIVANCGTSGSEPAQTWEIDTKTRTLYVRSTATTPVCGSAANMVFDSARGVMVFYAGVDPSYGQPTINETWEYRVTNLGNGEGCTAAFASSCASGFCVDGVCCDVAACTGACKSCNVAGSEGTCVQAAPGTEVPGSCAAGMACDGSGACKNKNGQACAAATECASGFCADGVCCDSACAGTCASCNQTGRVGQCTPYAAGTDPENECPGTGKCKATCDGVSACAFPQSDVACSKCHYCDGAGECSIYDEFSCGTGGSSGSLGGTGGSISYAGGSGGSSTPVRGGAGGGGGPMLGGAGGGNAVVGGGGSQGDAAGDASNSNVHKSGCSCTLGQDTSSGSDSTALLLIIGAVFSSVRKRKRR